MFDSQKTLEDKTKKETVGWICKVCENKTNHLYVRKWKETWSSSFNSLDGDKVVY